MAKRRLVALAALVLAAVSFALAVVSAVRHFPRGLFVLALLLLGLALAWHGLLRRGTRRALWTATGLAALAGALVLLLGRDPLITIMIVASAIGTLLIARSAFAVRGHLSPVAAPEHPVLIFNPRSGGGKANRFHLAEEARRRGIEPVELSPGTDLAALVQDALSAGADAIAMAGGDGSQAIVAAAAAEGGVPFACIPAGTRNHFALDLGVDRDDVVGALDALVCGAERRVDLAEVNGRVFVNNVSLGMYADAVQHGGYRDAKLRTLVDTLPDVAGPEADARLLRWRSSEGLTHEGGLALLVSNNPYRLGHAIGSGTRPRLDTGELGVAVIAPRDGIRRGLLRLWSQPEIEVEASRAVAAGIDGEAVRLESPLRFASRPAALRVRISLAHPGISPAAALPENGMAGLRALWRIASAREPRQRR